MSQVAAEPQVQSSNEPLDPALREMVEAGVFYGRTKTKTHPKLKSYIVANRNGIDIINLERTKETLEEALKALASKIGAAANPIVVGTQPVIQELVLSFAKEFDMPVVALRWLGGTLTNYKVISKRVEYYKKLKSDLASGALKAYTKKEQLDFEREAQKLSELLEGLVSMAVRPDLMIVIDPVEHRTAVLEAKRLGIPVFALMNTDCDPADVDYPVLGNTKTRKSIEWFLGKIVGAVREGKKKIAADAAALAAKAEKKEPLKESDAKRE